MKKTILILIAFASLTIAKADEAKTYLVFNRKYTVTERAYNKAVEMAHQMYALYVK
jgi:hypothetical protein